MQLSSRKKQSPLKLRCITECTGEIVSDDGSRLSRARKPMKLMPSDTLSTQMINVETDIIVAANIGDTLPLCQLTGATEL